MRHDALDVAEAARSTARMVRMHRKIGTAQRRKRLPPAKFPKLIEADYASKLVALVHAQRSALDPLLAALPELLASAATARGDERMDAGESRRATKLLDAARSRLVASVQPSKLDALAKKYAQATSEYQRQELQRQTQAQLGINVATIDRHVPTLIDHYVGENVSLIKTLGSGTMDKIEKMVTRSMTTGARHEELAQDIMDEFDVAERHARLIARDQIGKLYGQITAERHYELGVRRFIWRTVGDDRVREEHDAFERQSEAEPFLYDDPPIDETGEAVLPGEPICCRCSAEPVFDDILDAVDPESDTGSNTED